MYTLYNQYDTLIGYADAPCTSTLKINYYTCETAWDVQILSLNTYIPFTVV